VRFRVTPDPDERRAMLMGAVARVDRQVATLRTKVARLEAMIAEAEARRAHLEGHLRDLQDGRPPGHDPETGRS
jgi:cell division protein FtsB